MNKKLIAVAVAAGLALPMISAHAVEVADKKLEVYGKLHLNFGTFDKKVAGGDDNWQLSSYASRLGFKGQIKLDDGLIGTYKIESEIAIENGATDFATRNTYVGLKGGFGEVRIGRHDSPLKMAQGKFDQFGDTDGDLKHAGDEDGENRNKNSITYLVKSGNIGFNAQIIPGEGDGVTVGDGPADTISVAVSYKDGPLYVALAQDSYDSTGGAAEDSLTRLVATYKMSGMQFGALYQTGVEAPDTAAAKEDWLGLSFNMKMGKNNKFKAQYIVVEDSATSTKEGTHLSIGIDHKLGKKGTVYAMYNSLKEEDTAVSVDNSSVSVGYILKF
ncbi:MAG: porin [Woeseiaceae bacterium]